MNVIEKLKNIGEKYSIATEYHDNLITGDFVELSPLTRKLVNQIGNEILQTIAEEERIIEEELEGE